MGETIELTAEDGHKLAAYKAEPKGTPKGAVVIFQEIFGVNSHIRADTDKFAEHGFTAIAPAVFDRAERGVELDYVPDDVAKGRAYVEEIGWDNPVKDVKAAAEAVKGAGLVFGVGYCWGGSLAWLAATRLGIPSAGYYGGRTAGLSDEKPLAPVMLHFGETDAMIPMSDVQMIAEKHPAIMVHVYKDAGHGFNCDQRPDYREDAASLALRRTLAFFDAQL